MSTPLKRDAGIPLYQQLADKIKDQIGGSGDDGDGGAEQAGGTGGQHVHRFRTDLCPVDVHTSQLLIQERHQVLIFIDPLARLIREGHDGIAEIVVITDLVTERHFNDAIRIMEGMSVVREISGIIRVY